MSGEFTDGSGPRGWVLYDGDCAFCLRWVRRFRGPLERRGFRLAPLQTPWVRKRLGLPADELLAELRLLMADGQRFGGADALVEIARHLWWGWPLYALAWLPSARRLLAAGYRWGARHRQCVRPREALSTALTDDFVPRKVSPACPAQ